MIAEPDKGSNRRPQSAERRRRWRWAAAGAALIAGGAAVSVLVAGTGDETAPIVIAVRDVPAGHTLSEDDLRVVHLVGTAGLGLVEASTVEEVAGRRVVVPLRTGTPLVEQVLADAGEWPVPGRAVVAVALPAGTVPQSLDAGSAVGVVITDTGPASSKEDAKGADATPPVKAMVDAVHHPDDDAGVAETVVELGVAAADAPLVAAAQNMRLVLMHDAETGPEGDDA